MRYFLLCVVLLPFSLIFSQEDPKARVVLDKVSDVIRSYDAFRASYEFVYDDVKTGDQSEEKGDILIKGNQYRITQDQVVIYYNGNSLWTYMIGKKECTVMSPQAGKGVFDFTNPRTIFYFHQDDFKYQYIDEESLDGVSYHVIDLYPVDFSASEFSRIRLRVNAETHHVYKLQAFGKDGVHYIFTIYNLTTHVDVSDGQFIFREEKHPDVEVIDMRF